MKRHLILLLLIVSTSLGSLSGCHSLARHGSRSGVRSTKNPLRYETPLHFQETYYFDSNHWDLGPEEKQKLSSSIRALKEHEGLVAILQGHTDQRGSSEYNLELGDRRARAIKWELAQGGIAPDRLVVVSLGESKPLKKERSPQDRAANRRVEIILK